MAAATYEQFSFLGGEWSKTVQGRVDRPDYRTAMNACLNSLPMEQGAWAKRPGFKFMATTRSGVPGRLISFDFKQAVPYTMEFTAGHLRFFAGNPFFRVPLVTTSDGTNDPIVSISTANPAVVQLSAAVSGVTGTQGFFSGLGTTSPLLQNRMFTLTRIDSTHFSLADAITGDNIDGSTLGWVATPGAGLNFVLDFVTPYTGTLWQSLRSVQADIPTANATTPGAVFLHGSIKPYVLQVVTAQTASAYATFTLAAATFKDGPYFDPVPGGTLATPSALIGNITLTLSFPAYSATTSYSIGDYVTSASVNYKSLTDANVNHTPAGSPTNWVAVSAADAIGPNGFQGSDVGRHVRLYSEPALWSSATTYAKDAVVAYGGTGVRSDGAVYWISLVASNTNNIPGADLTKWALYPNGARWTWGRITALSNIIDRALTGSANIGDMTAGGGIAAAFDGVISQAASASAEKTTSASGNFGGGTVITLSSFVGKNYSGASDQKISQAVFYPSNDNGLAFGTCALVKSTAALVISSITLNLRGKSSAPSSASDGTLLGTSGPVGNTTAPIIIASSDQTTSWKYVWVEQLTTAATPIGLGAASSYSLTNADAELSLFNPAGSGTSQGAIVQIVGDALLYTTAIRTWRLGLYSDTTGWPTCGTYHEGRLWLSGVIANRIDSSRSNDLFNFAPTNADGTVPSNAGISYTFNAPDVNPIFWMVPDYQGIICGTQAGEWLVQASSQNLPLTPTSIQAHRVTTNQCANIEPRRTDLTLAVVQSYKRELLEYFPDVYSGKFTAQDLAWSAKHLTKTGIQEIAYQQETIATLWGRCGDGSLIGATYKRKSLVSSQEPEAHGWHRHTLGSGRTVESITLAATADGTLPILAMVTNDSDTGIRHVEMATKMLEETDSLTTAWLLDNSIVPSATLSDETAIVGAPYGGLTLYGLWHLNGESVTVFAGGLDCGEFTVANGSLFMPYGDGISGGTGNGLFTATFAASGIQIVVGFTYNADGQIVRPSSPAESGARIGPAFGKKRRQHWYVIQVANTAGLKIGTDFNKLIPIPFKNSAGRNLQPLNTATGIYADTFADEYSFDSMLCWRSERPLPAMVAAIGGFIHTQDQ